MEANTIMNHSGLYHSPDDALLHILKDSQLLNQNLKHDSVQEQSQRSKLGNLMAVDSGLLCYDTSREDKLVSVLNGEYCGLGTHSPIEYADIFEILKTEILAAQAQEIDVIKNGILNGDDESKHEFFSMENGKKTMIGEHQSPDFIEGSESHCIATRPGDEALAPDKQEEARKCDETDSSACGLLLMQAQSILPNGQADLEFRAANGICSDTRGLDPENGQELSERSSTPLSFVEGTEPHETNADPPDNKQTHLESSASCSRHGEESSLDKGYIEFSDNAQSQLDRLIACSRAAEVSALSGKNMDQSFNGEGEDGDRSLQTVEGMTARNLEVASKADCEGNQQHEDLMVETAGGASLTADHHRNTEDVRGDGCLNVLVVEVTGDAEGLNIHTDNANLSEVSKGNNAEGPLQTDNFEHSEDENRMLTAFSGPIPFSGTLSFSGMIPYSGQLSYSGNLSLHSDSSASTRSFAFPILASDWNSSPARIGQPDSQYFRRRRRWRPCCCCRRPTTLYD